MGIAVPFSVARISDAALVVLQIATIGKDRVVLPDTQLDRTLYEEVNDVLVRIGGKWKGGKTRAHIFSYDPAPLMEAVLDTGLMPAKNPSAYFPTPAHVVNEIITEANLSELMDSSWRILEPSAGTGAFADAIKLAAPGAHIDVVETLPINASVLRHKGYDVHEMDFLDFTTDVPYDVILMNPPFSIEGDASAYMTHVNHAWSLLKENGILISVVPQGFTFRNDKKSIAFRRMVCEYGNYWTLPEGTFKESGTMAGTSVIKLRKCSDKEVRQEINGWHCWHCWTVDMIEENESKFYPPKETLRKTILTFDKPEQLRYIKAHYEKVAESVPEDCIFLIDECYEHLLQYFLSELT